MFQGIGIGFLFKQIHDAFEAEANNQLQKMDLTMSQLAVLCFLFKNENREVTQREIENYLNLKHPTVTGILQRMEMKGFVSCSKNCDDKRQKNISLTEKALELRKRINVRLTQMEDRLVDGLTKDERLMLNELLDKVYNNVTVRM